MTRVKTSGGDDLIVLGPPLSEEEIANLVDIGMAVECGGELVDIQAEWLADMPIGG